MHLMLVRLCCAVVPFHVISAADILYFYVCASATRLGVGAPMRHARISTYTYTN